MISDIPTPQQIRDQLASLNHAAVQALSASSGVPFTTLWKIRSGETDNPRLETVRAIWPELIGTQPAATQQEASHG
jgi:hypothetical protein